jgi:uncharacterized protein
MARDAPSIDAYGQGGFRLSGQRHEGSVLILEDTARPWPVVDFLLLGVGPTNARPSREVREALAAAGVGLEFMDTPAAARLYNVLTSEGRRLAAALIAV